MRILIALLLTPTIAVADIIAPSPNLADSEMTGLFAYRLLLLACIAIFFYRIRKPKAELARLPQRRAESPTRIAR